MPKEKIIDLGGFCKDHATSLLMLSFAAGASIAYGAEASSVTAASGLLCKAFTALSLGGLAAVMENRVLKRFPIKLSNG
jgi:hypothetical protein